VLIDRWTSGLILVKLRRFEDVKGMLEFLVRSVVF
jgi:hypothetical protein